MTRMTENAFYPQTISTLRDKGKFGEKTVFRSFRSFYSGKSEISTSATMTEMTETFQK